jgi:hypothetical protein
VPVITTASDWWPITGRAGMGVAVPAVDFEADPKVGDQVDIGGTMYRIYGVEFPGPRNGHWGLLVQQVGSYLTR